MTGTLLRRLIARDRVFVAVRIRFYGKVEAGTRHSAGQMVTDMPVACAAAVSSGIRASGTTGTGHRSVSWRFLQKPWPGGSYSLSTSSQNRSIGPAKVSGRSSGKNSRPSAISMTRLAPGIVSLSQ